MLSAAELQALHQQGQQQQQGSSAAAPPLVDPFPSLREQDPFPAPPRASVAAQGPSTAAAVANGHAGKPANAPAPAAAAPPAAAQPDFNSQDLFPSLSAAAPTVKGQWAQKSGTQRAVGSASTWSSAAPVIQRTMHQEVLSIPSSEETSAKISNIIQRVQNKHKGVKVEASTTRKQTSFVVTGTNEAAVKAAKRELTVGLARNVSLTLTIPSSLRAFVIGQKGKNLKSITEQTGVRINIPKADENAQPTARPAADFDYDVDEQIEVTIEGDEINARTAKDLLSALVAERTSRTTQRLGQIEHVFYPFIAGPKNAHIASLEEGRDVSIRVPPRVAFLPPRENEGDSAEPKRERDLSIVVSGDRDAVTAVVQLIESNVEEMRRSFRTLNISIPKRQHRFLVGDAAQEILAATECSIELAPIDDPSDSVTIRGPQAKLPSALTVAIEKANAVRVEVVDVGAAHRNLEHAKVLLRWLGVSNRVPREQGVQVYLPRSAIVESSGVAHIEVVGADETVVSRVRTQLEATIKSVPPSSVASVDIDSLLHRFIIGKKGSGLTQYAKKGVDVIFPPVGDATASTDGRSDVLLVLGDAGVLESLPKEKKAREAAAAAILDQVKADIETASKQAADLKTETLSIPAKYHRALLGPGGTTLNAILGEERLAAVKLGSSSSAAGKGTGNAASSQDEDTVTVRGPSSEVERVVKALQKIAKEAEEDSIVNGHTVEMSISSQYVPHIVGRGGAGITKLREDLGVKIDFGDSNGAEGAKKAATVKVVIVGRKENVEEAKKRILSQSEKLADETTLTLKVPANLHGSIIGQGGKYVTRLQDNYSVRINFPSQGGNSDSASTQKPDEVVIKGGKKGVEGAKAELLELIEYEKENNNVVTVPVSTKSIARIMGRGGANVNRLRDETDAQIDVDREDAQGSNSETTTIRLRGTKQAIAAAKAAILAVAADVDAEASYAVDIPSRFHGQLIGPGGQNLRDIITRAGGDAEAKTATQLIQFPRRGAAGEQADVVTVRGPAALAGKVKDELERIAKDLQSRIVVGVVVPPSQHRSLMGRIRELQSVHSSARIIVPGWREYEQLEIGNAEELSSAAPASIVKIQGSKEACEALQKEISQSFVTNSQSVSVPRAIAVKMSGSSIIRRLRTDYGVSIDAPKVSGGGDAAGSAAKPSAPAGAARIDDDLDEESVESLPYELTKIDLSSSDDAVTWSLSAKSGASLKEAVAELELEVKRLQRYTAQARLWVDQRAIPRIVGRGGAGLREIEAQTESSIDIPRDQGGLVIILGTDDSVEEARQRIGRIALQPARQSRD